MVTAFSQSLIFKSWLKLSSGRILCSIARLNNESNIGNVGGINFNELSSVDKEIVNVLQSHSFNDEDINHILNRVERRKSVIPNLNSKMVHESIMYWAQKIKSNYAESETGITKQLRKTLSRVEPDLLFVSKPKMDERIELVMNLGVLTGKEDFARVFHNAPRGYLLQDWHELKKKFIYFHYSIFTKYTKANKLGYPTPHPLVKYPKIIEQTYEHIKARYLFGVFTGLQSKNVLSSLKEKELDFGAIILDDLEKYLRKVAPNCTEEEYEVFEEMVAEMQDDEDQIIQELAELGGNIDYKAKVPSVPESTRPKGKRKKRL